MHSRPLLADLLDRWEAGAQSAIQGTPAEDLGAVEASGVETAIQIAIEQFHIDDPHRQQRLVARRME